MIREADVYNAMLLPIQAGLPISGIFLGMFIVSIEPCIGGILLMFSSIPLFFVGQWIVEKWSKRLLKTGDYVIGLDIAGGGGSGA